MAAVRLEVFPKNTPKQWIIRASRQGVKESETPIELTGYVWAPDGFVPWCKMMLGGLSEKIPQTETQPDSEYPLRLTNPLPEALTREDKRISEALTSNPLDPTAHEEAALLIGSFAMRQPEGAFADIKAELSAITAHLALADAIRGKRGACGDLAEAVLCALVGRETLKRKSSCVSKRFRMESKRSA